MIVEDFTSTFSRYASMWVEARLFQKFLQTSRQKLVNFLKQTTAIPETAAFRGLLFEPFAHNRLMHGGNFEVRNLEDPNGKLLF
jgi:hypothetical protein